MKFVKEFIMNHPFISMLIAGAIFNRVEDATGMLYARKTGTEYYGHRWNYCRKKEDGADTMKAEVKDE